MLLCFSMKGRWRVSQTKHFFFTWVYSSSLICLHRFIWPSRKQSSGLLLMWPRGHPVYVTHRLMRFRIRVNDRIRIKWLCCYIFRMKHLAKENMDTCHSWLVHVTKGCIFTREPLCHRGILSSLMLMPWRPVFFLFFPPSHLVPAH